MVLRGNQIMKSKKDKKQLKDIVTDRMFILPRALANDRDPETGEPCVMAAVNGVKAFVPVDKQTPIPYSAYCILKDIGLINSYNEEDGFDPL